MIKAKVALLEDRLLSSQSEQSEKFSKNPDWLEISGPSIKATFGLIIKTGYRYFVCSHENMFCKKGRRILS